MKIPFVIILRPILKPYFSSSRLFCQHPSFTVSVPYTYVYSALGVIINVHKLVQILGKSPLSIELSDECNKDNRNKMIVHDLKIIAMSIGFFQYSCLLAGCFTENPSLFLPYLAGHLTVVCLKAFSAFYLLLQVDVKALSHFVQKLFAVIVMTFNWLQGFCVFRKHLCICDL